MPTSFLGSEEYDERAHRLYNDGDYDGAMRLLREGLSLYPHSVDLYVGLGFAHLAREEYIWAKQALDKALVLDPDNRDALVGLGEALLRFGDRNAALEHFRRVRVASTPNDLDLILTMGRALYRERLYDEARSVFAEGVELCPESADALAGLAYTHHRLGAEAEARRCLRDVLRLSPNHNEARVYLGHLLYDRGHWAGALREFERVSPEDHWDPVAIWRLLELKRALRRVEPGDPRLQGWEDRLEELELAPDPIDELLAEVESGDIREAGTAEGEQVSPETSGRAANGTAAGPHRVRTRSGDVFGGSWEEIVLQLHERYGREGESLEQFLRRRAEIARREVNMRVPEDDAEGFLLANASAGFLLIES